MTCLLQSYLRTRIGNENFKITTSNKYLAWRVFAAFPPVVGAGCRCHCITWSRTVNTACVHCCDRDEPCKFVGWNKKNTWRNMFFVCGYCANAPEAPWLVHCFACTCIEYNFAHLHNTFEKVKLTERHGFTVASFRASYQDRSFTALNEAGILQKNYDQTKQNICLAFESLWQAFV